LRLTANVNDFDWDQWHYYKAGDVVYLVDGPVPNAEGIPVIRVAYWESHRTDPGDRPEVFILSAHLVDRAVDVPDRDICSTRIRMQIEQQERERHRQRQRARDREAEIHDISSM
jgi:hypothetical protein